MDSHGIRMVSRIDGFLNKCTTVSVCNASLQDNNDKKVALSTSGRVVRKPVNVNPGLNEALYFLVQLKMFFTV